MPLVSQKLDNLLDGVSQRDEVRRPPSTAEEQVNALSDPTEGLRKRPGTQYVALLDSDVDAHETAFVHTIDRDQDNKFRVIVRDGDIKAFYADTGEEVPVTIVSGAESYLSGSDFRAVSVEDITYLVNQDTTVSQATTVSTLPDPAALFYVRAGAEDTNYTINVDDFEGSHTTPVSSGDVAVDTKDIAEALKDALEAEPGFTGEFTAERVGSTVHVYRDDGKDFDASYEDGLGDTGILLLKDTVQSFSGLPRVAPNGFVVEVVGDPGTEFDNFWVQFQSYEEVGERGVWKEIVEPGVLTEFDASTMPHQLVVRGLSADDSVSKGSPPQPTVTQDSKATFESIWGDLRTPWNWTDVWTGGGVSETNIASSTVPHFIKEDGDFFEWEVDAQYVGNPMQFDLYFGVNTQNMALDNVAVLTVYQDDGAGNLTELSQEIFTRGDDFDIPTSGLGAFPSITFTPASGELIRLTLTYENTPTGGEEAIIEDAIGESLQVINLQEQVSTINWGLTEDYPGGFEIELTLSGTDVFTYTPSVDETGEDVAEAFQALVDADGGYSAEYVGGKLSVQEGAGSSSPSVSVVYDFDENTDAWVEGADFTGLSLVGTVITNVTDGSSAVITVQNDTVLETDGLTGGSDDLFEEGDVLQIEAETGVYFVFKEVEWEARASGDDTTNPFPGFVGRTITDMAYYQGRLGFVYLDRIFFSAAGKLKRLFRKTSRQVLADDPIGAESSLPTVSAFIDAIYWNNFFYLRAENGIVSVTGDPILTPSTIQMDLVASIQSHPGLSSAVVGRSLYISRRGSKGIQVHEGSQVESDVLNFREISSEVPSYMDGEPIQLVGSGSHHLLVILPSCTTNTLYVYKYFDAGRERIQSSWSRWEFPEGGTILAIDIIDGVLGVVSKYSDGVYLESIDLDEAIE